MMKIDLTRESFRTKIHFSYLLVDPFIAWSVKIIFIITGLEFLTLVVLWKFIPPQVPLLYSRPWGEEQLVEKKMLFLIPFICLLFSAVNLTLGNYFLTREKLLGRIFVFTNLLVNFLLTVTFLEILFLTTF